MKYLYKVVLSLIVAVNVSLSFSSVFFGHSDTKIKHHETNLAQQFKQFNKELSLKEAHILIDETRKNFEKKLVLLDIYWEQGLYHEVMTIINYLSEKLDLLFIQEVKFDMLFLPLGMLANSDLTWMKNQVNSWKERIKTSDKNNDALLSDFFLFQEKADVLDDQINHELRGLAIINWQDEEQLYHFFQNNFDYLQNTTEKYNLLNREIFEWENSSNYRNYLYSLDKYQQFNRLYSFITVKIKNNFHYFIKRIIESINQEVTNLINEIAEVKKEPNMVHQYLIIINKWELIKRYQDYLISEELQENLSSQFAQFDRLAIRIEKIINEDYPLLISNFHNNLVKLKQNLTKKVEKINLYGGWEEIVELHQVFKEYQHDYQIMREEKNIGQEIKEIDDIFKTIHYQGINYVKDDPDDDSLLIKYMTDQAFTEMVNGYMSDKQMISVLVDTITGAVITTGFSVAGAMFGGLIGAIFGAIAGALVSYAVSKAIDQVMDLFYGEWTQVLNHFRDITKGAGVMFKIPKHYTLPHQAVVTIENTICPQEPKFL